MDIKTTFFPLPFLETTGWKAGRLFDCGFGSALGSVGKSTAELETELERGGSSTTEDWGPGTSDDDAILFQFEWLKAPIFPLDFNLTPRIWDREEEEFDKLNESMGCNSGNWFWRARLSL